MAVLPYEPTQLGVSSMQPDPFDKFRFIVPDARHAITPASIAEAEKLFESGQLDPKINEIIQSHTAGDATASMKVEAVRNNPQLRQELGNYFVDQMQAQRAQTPYRIRVNDLKNTDDIGQVSSREAAARIALSKLDGTFRADLASANPVVIEKNGEVTLGMHHVAADQILMPHQRSSLLNGNGSKPNSTIEVVHGYSPPKDVTEMPSQLNGSDPVEPKLKSSSDEWFPKTSSSPTILDTKSSSLLDRFKGRISHLFSPPSAEKIVVELGRATGTASGRSEVETGAALVDEAHANQHVVGTSSIEVASGSYTPKSTEATVETHDKTRLPEAKILDPATTEPKTNGSIEVAKVYSPKDTSIEDSHLKSRLAKGVELNGQTEATKSNGSIEVAKGGYKPKEDITPSEETAKAHQSKGVLLGDRTGSVKTESKIEVAHVYKPKESSYTTSSLNGTKASEPTSDWYPKTSSKPTILGDSPVKPKESSKIEVAHTYKPKSTESVSSHGSLNGNDPSQSHSATNASEPYSKTSSRAAVLDPTTGKPVPEDGLGGFKASGFKKGVGDGLTSAWDTAGENIKGMSGLAKAAGLAGTAVALGYTGYQAGKDIKAGDYGKAAKDTATNAGSIAGVGALGLVVGTGPVALAMGMVTGLSGDSEQRKKAKMPNMEVVQSTDGKHTTIITSASEVGPMDLKEYHLTASTGEGKFYKSKDGNTTIMVKKGEADNHFISADLKAGQLLYKSKNGGYLIYDTKDGKTSKLSPTAGAEMAQQFNKLNAQPAAGHYKEQAGDRVIGQTPDSKIIERKDGSQLVVNSHDKIVNERGAPSSAVVASSKETVKANTEKPGKHHYIKESGDELLSAGSLTTKSGVTVKTQMIKRKNGDLVEVGANDTIYKTTHPTTATPANEPKLSLGFQPGPIGQKNEIFVPAKTKTVSSSEVTPPSDGSVESMTRTIKAGGVSTVSAKPSPSAVHIVKDVAHPIHGDKLAREITYSDGSIALTGDHGATRYRWIKPPPPAGSSIVEVSNSPRETTVETSLIYRNGKWVDRNNPSVPLTAEEQSQAQSVWDEQHTKTVSHVETVSPAKEVPVVSAGSKVHQSQNNVKQSPGTVHQYSSTHQNYGQPPSSSKTEVKTQMTGNSDSAQKVTPVPKAVSNDGHTKPEHRIHETAASSTDKNELDPWAVNTVRENSKSTDKQLPLDPWAINPIKEAEKINSKQLPLDPWAVNTVRESKLEAKEAAKENNKKLSLDPWAVDLVKTTSEKKPNLGTEKHKATSSLAVDPWEHNNLSHEPQAKPGDVYKPSKTSNKELDPWAVNPIKEATGESSKPLPVDPWARNTIREAKAESSVASKEESKSLPLDPWVAGTVKESKASSQQLDPWAVNTVKQSEAKLPADPWAVRYITPKQEDLTAANMTTHPSSLGDNVATGHGLTTPSSSVSNLATDSTTDTGSDFAPKNVVHNSPTGQPLAVPQTDVVETAAKLSQPYSNSVTLPTVVDPHSAEFNTNFLNGFSVSGNVPGAPEVRSTGHGQMLN